MITIIRSVRSKLCRFPKPLLSWHNESDFHSLLTEILDKKDLRMAFVDLKKAYDIRVPHKVVW